MTEHSQHYHSPYSYHWRNFLVVLRSLPSSSVSIQRIGWWVFGIHIFDLPYYALNRDHSSMLILFFGHGWGVGVFISPGLCVESWLGENETDLLSPHWLPSSQRDLIGFVQGQRSKGKMVPAVWPAYMLLVDNLSPLASCNEFSQSSKQLVWPG